ncbi:MAG: Gfo/Idh/MocA family oxidoreductase [Acidobacteriota bacterium]|nr:Gfo/Idh/MocA family oxidoreductase [Acidobacteriota bacterium]
MTVERQLLRVGLIGSGKMGRHHLKAIGASQLAHVVGIADPVASPDELRPLVPQDAIVVASAAELIERARPDVVHIVTPPATHTELALLAIRAGCHVYVEKPFTPTADEASRILALAAEQGVRVCAGHQVLFEAPALEVWNHLDEIGRMVHIESYFSFKMVRRTITAVDQVKDILPHAVYPVVDQLRAGTGLASDPIDILGLSLDASGEVYALLRLGAVTAVLVVTLNGRPVEQYQSIVGTNGSLRPDYIGGFLGKLVGPGTGPGVLLTPYRRAFHTMSGTTRGVIRLIRGGSYPGLRTLVRRFYESIRDGSDPPLTPRSIVDTVRICEQIGRRLDEVELVQEGEARERLAKAEDGLGPPMAGAPVVLLTGGTGLLGKRVAEEVRRAGFPVRVVTRRTPPYSRRVPGVEYTAADLANGVDSSMMKHVGFVVHAAAETSGGKEDHRRNSVEATRQIITAAAQAGVRGVVHVSSLAVLKTSREVGRALDETAPVDAGSLARGPYVWGKAESEIVAQQLGAQFNLPVKVIRPGPLVDYGAYHPPGRLGRELGPLYVAIGPKRGDLNVCDVSTAARVVRSYLQDFDAAPAMLNMVEAPPPRRRDLMERYRKDRPDLRVLWFPGWLLRAMSGPLKLIQRLALGSTEPIDVAAAFASERYQTDLAASVIARAGAAARPPSRAVASSRT